VHLDSRLRIFCRAIGRPVASEFGEHLAEYTLAAVAVDDALVVDEVGCGFGQRALRNAFRHGLLLKVGDVLPVNAVLEIGNLTEQVSVSSQGTLLETETSSTNTVTEGDFLYKMPLYQRYVLNTLNLNPGVTMNGYAYGGSLGGFYTLSLTLVGRRFSRDELPGANAAFVIGCTERDLAFKCTAGLHHAVRHTDPATGFTHHGFLNILAATRAARRGEPARVAELLASRSGDELAAEISGLTDRRTAGSAAAAEAKGDGAADGDQTSDHRTGGRPTGAGSYADDPTGGGLPEGDLPDSDLPCVDPTGGDTTGADRIGGGQTRDHRINDLRALFTAYGTCSISEPLDDLAALGLIALPEKNLDHG